MAVKPWTQPDVLDELTAFMLKNRVSMLVENYVFQFAHRVYEMNSMAARQWERENVVRTPRPALVEWPFLSEGRRHPSPNYLWYETAPIEAYVQMAAALGLSLTADAFTTLCS